MMKTRMAAVLCGVALGLAAVAAPAVAQDGVEPTAPGGPNNVDGAYVVADDDGEPTVIGEGEERVLGDIDTGGAGGEPIIYDEGAVIPDIGALRDAAESAIAGDEDEPGAAIDAPTAAEPEPAVVPAEEAAAETEPTEAAPVEGGTESTIVTSSEDGETTEIGLPPAPVVAPASEGAAPAAAGGCGDYAGWYEAQIAYEGAGGVGADAGLVAALDPDGDGIACEEAMTTS